MLELDKHSKTPLKCPEAFDHEWDLGVENFHSPLQPGEGLIDNPPDRDLVDTFYGGDKS